MGVFEPWIADCHLQNIITSEEYLCKAAIWSDGYPMFRARLKAHLQDSDFKLLWLEECLTAPQYITRHGQQKEIGSLARAVHGRHVVQLSEMQASGSGEVVEPEAYLTIEDITGIEPLDQQFGVHPRKTVPDALLEPLFGEVQPTDAEIEQYGSIDAVPSMKTYAILDAAKMPYMLTTQLDSSGLQHQSLFQGETAEELKEHAPYLVQLEDGNRFTEKLFTGPKGINGLWEKELGIYIRSRASFSDVRKHFRKFTKLQDNKGAWYYLRFWEKNTVLSIFSLKENRETICRFFYIDGSGETIQIFTPKCTLKAYCSEGFSPEGIEKISVTNFVGLILPQLRALKLSDDAKKIVSEALQDASDPEIIEKLNASAKYLVDSGFKKKTQLTELLKLEKCSNFTFLSDEEVCCLIGSKAPDFAMFVKLTGMALRKGMKND